MQLLRTAALLVLHLATCASAAATYAITGSILPSAALVDPSSLPPSTLLTLSTLGVENSRETLILSDNTFTFRNVSVGSYLLDVNCRTHLFAPLRVDVKSNGIVEVYGTFRGNEWGNLGERKIYPIDIRAVKASEFYVTREGFNPMSLLQNPMILIAIVSIGGMVLMPKLLDNMDPELKAEFEKTKAESPLLQTLNGGGGGGSASANAIQNFDLPSYLAGATKKADGGSGSSTPKRK